MKRIFTVLSILFTSLGLVQAQTILWGGPSDPNSTFMGGMNGWTTQGLSSADPAKADSATWYYSAAANAAGGAYWGARGQIQSPSRANGAMVFNSDFYDNAGIVGNFGNGKCPAPHTGVLVSPVIDCSAFPGVALKFNQYYRNFQSTTFVDISNDGGANWTSFQVNETIPVNQETATNNQITIDISNVAAQQANVQIRFRFEGEYYFWIIDDVQLIDVPAFDLALNSHFYTPAAYRQPKDQICFDTMIFSANLNNKGSMAQTNVVLVGEILDIDRKTVLFRDSVIVARLETTDDDTTFRTDNYFVPNKLPFGRYYFRYTVYGLDANGDYNQIDNIRLDSFEVSLDDYTKAPRATSGVRAGSGAGYIFGNLYRTSNCWNANDQWKATKTRFSMVANPGGTLDAYSVSIYFLKVNDDIEQDWSNFDGTGGITSPSIEILSAESFTGTTEQNFQLIEVDLTDFNTGDPGILLKPNSRYFIGTEHPPTPTGAVPIFHSISNEKSYNAQAFSTFVIDAAGEWFNGFQGVNTPIQELQLALVSSTDEKPLADHTMEVYPNPVADGVLKVSLNFEKATDANITLAQLDGKIVGFDSHKAIDKSIIPVSVQDLNAGTYLIRVSTEEGTLTKKFTVIK
ncbi:MAG: T9SS type A sorting domain-containing protein [Saprospiraceae bacterium]|nr:T9SS type A sorting domain-containing protein [Saprospiraceae bacterium]